LLSIVTPKPVGNTYLELCLSVGVDESDKLSECLSVSRLARPNDILVLPGPLLHGALMQARPLHSVSPLFNPTRTFFYPVSPKSIAKLGFGTNVFIQFHMNKPQTRHHHNAVQFGHPCRDLVATEPEPDQNSTRKSFRRKFHRTLQTGAVIATSPLWAPVLLGMVLLNGQANVLKLWQKHS